jgi:hypothetical protein
MTIMLNESIDQLITDISRLAPSNKIEKVGSDCFRVNRTIVRITGNIVTYGHTRLKFKNIYNLLESLDRDGIIDISTTK